MRVLSSAFFLLMVAGALAHSQDAPSREAIKKEIELLRGTWSFTIAAAGDEVKIQFKIYGDESFDINMGGNHINGARTIDPLKKPKHITLTPDGSKQLMLGIYKLEGDTLTLCLAAKRPTEFKGTPGSAHWVLQREKPNK
jgi:uncharacterized protein (TIGR03067 family)